MAAVFPRGRERWCCTNECSCEGRVVCRRTSALGAGTGQEARPTKGGSAILEAALFVPIIFALFIGMEELARVTYNYYMIQKTLAGLARYLGTQQGVNFCNGADPILKLPSTTH